MIATFSEHHKTLRQSVETVVKEKVVPRAAEIDTTDEYPDDLRQLFAKLGYLSIVVPKEYGGQGDDMTSACIITEEIAKASASCAQITYGAMGTSYMLLTANDEQKARLYPAIASGEKSFGLSLTEPNAGSDLAGIETSAVLDGDRYVVNGTKTFATGAGFWNGWLTLVKTDPTKGSRGLSILLIETDMPGFHLGHHDDKLGLRGVGGGEIVLDNAIVPKTNLIGGEGEGRNVLREAMVPARIGHAAVALGIAEGALDCAVNYVKSRFRLEKLLTELQDVQQVLAQMVIRAETAHAILYQVTALADQNYKEPSLEKYASIVRYYCGEAAMSNTTDALQLLGIDSYGKDFPVERMMRDAKAYEILEGTQQIQQLIIAHSVLRA
jgi:alkylation response protein AidB-like acyl-CoA dehydrogenase